MFSVEQQGDGSGNYTDWYKPAISIFTNITDRNNAILKFLKYIDKDYANNFEANCINKEKVYEAIIANGGFLIEKYPDYILRISNISINTLFIKTSYWDFSSKKLYYEIIDDDDIAEYK